jgi:hypothetical protein
VYGLPENTDLSAFVGCELELVSISLHQVNLNFDGLRKIGITIEGHYAVSGTDAAQARYSAAPKGAAGLVRLLGSRVTDVQIADRGTTTVRFVGGAAIMIYDSTARPTALESNSPTYVAIRDTARTVAPFVALKTSAPPSLLPAEQVPARTARL